MELKQRDRVEILVLLVLILVMGLGLFTLIYTKASLAPPPEPAVQASPTPAPAPTPLPTLRPVPTPEPSPALRERTELLRLANPLNLLPEGYEPELAMTEEEEYVDARCAEPLARMLADCRQAGNAPYICSAYRTTEKQTYLYNNKIQRLINEGVDPAKAPAVAARSVAIPGASEHQLGLAVDIIDYYYPYLDRQQEETGTQQWLMENSWRYGFILRYPSDKSDITGTIYEPWHYRYVGPDEAAEIYELGLCLEEYLEQFYEPQEAE